MNQIKYFNLVKLSWYLCAITLVLSIGLLQIRINKNLEYIQEQYVDIVHAEEKIETLNLKIDMLEAKIKRLNSNEH